MVIWIIVVVILVFLGLTMLDELGDLRRSAWRWLKRRRSSS